MQNPENVQQHTPEVEHIQVIEDAMNRISHLIDEDALTILGPEETSAATVATLKQDLRAELLRIYTEAKQFGDHRVHTTYRDRFNIFHNLLICGQPRLAEEIPQIFLDVRAEGRSQALSPEHAFAAYSLHQAALAQSE